MRRNVRKKIKREEDLNIKIIKYCGIAVAILTVIVFGLLVYSKTLNDEVKEGTLTSEQLSSILNSSNIIENTESTSLEIGKTVNELTKENEVNDIENDIKTKNEVLTTEKITITNSENTNNKDKEPKKEENKVELKFEKPLEGDVVREFAVDSLIYSETLQEWTTHNGIDIKADKMTVVKSAEEGKVKTIKNDPRYGLTVIVEHENGFETVYSNLLTSEFVVEGENIKKGQSIGTVGNTAAFEIADEPHLHFEIIKDSVQLDPNIYLK